MREYTIIGLAIALVSILIIIPNLVHSRSQPSTPLPPHPIPDSLFLPSNTSSLALQKKLKQFQNQIDELTKKQGGNCTAWDLEQLQNQVAACNTDLQKEGKLRLDYETKWNTTCQDWRAEITELENNVVTLTVQKNEGVTAIQGLDEQVGQLKLEVHRLKAQLPCRPHEPCPNCPESEPCSICPICQNCPTCEFCQECQICKVCPTCQDRRCDDLQTNHKALLQSFENLKTELSQCKDALNLYHLQLQDCQQSLNKTNNCTCNNTNNITCNITEECRIVQEGVTFKLKQNIQTLVGLVKAGKYSSASLKNLQDLIEKVESQLVNASNVNEIMGPVELLVAGLVAKAGQTEDKTVDALIKQCLGMYKTAVGQLEKCEQKLKPFIKK